MSLYLDEWAMQRREEALARGDVIDAQCGPPIIPWGPTCCFGCEHYDCGRTITSHGFCAVHKRRVSPHYFCEDWEQD